MEKGRLLSRTIGIASLIYAASILLSRVIGLVRESVIGRTLGVGREADVYWLAFILPDWLNYALASGVLSLVFIPIFQAHLARGDEAAAWRAFSIVSTFVLLLAIAGTAALWWLAPQLAPWVGPGLTPEWQARLAELTRIVLPAQVFHVVGGLLSATLQARDRHALPALAPLVYTGGIIAGGLILGPHLGAEGFAWGVLAGSIAGPFALPLWGAARGGLRWRPRFAWRDLDFRRYLWRSLPVMIGASVVALDDLVVKWFASDLDAGAVSRLQYARTLMKIPLGVFGFAAGMAAFPTLSRLIAEGRPGEARATLLRATRTMLILVIAAQAALTVSGEEIATVIWGTTRFSPADLAEIGRLTGLLSLGLWAWAAQILLARGFYAVGNTWLPTAAGTTVLLAALPLYWLGARGWAAEGLAVASSVAISLYSVALAVLLRRHLRRAAATPTAPDPPGLPDALARLIPAAALGAALGWGLRAALPDATPALVRGLLSGGLAAAVTVAAAHALRLPEARQATRALLRRRS